MLLCLWSLLVFLSPCVLKLGEGKCFLKLFQNPQILHLLKGWPSAGDFTVNERLTRSSDPLFWGRELTMRPRRRVEKSGYF